MRKAHTVTLTKRVVVHNPNNLPTIHYSLLNDFQEDLKYITEENLEKLKQSILKHGIFVPKFVWLHDEKYFTIDGHQTVKALRSLESEGYFIPDIPIVEIDAANESDAAEKLLQINSQHGTFNVNTTFFEKKNLDLKIISGLIEIPELQILDLSKMETTEPIQKEYNENIGTENECPKCGYKW